MINKLLALHNKLNEEFKNTMPFNDKKFRSELKERFRQVAPNALIKCDEENNNAEVIDMQCGVIKIEWSVSDTRKDTQIAYFTFGSDAARQQLLTIPKGFV